MAKKQRWIVTSPIATLGYGYLRMPDTKYNKDGDFKLDFFLSPDDAKKFCTEINKDPRANGQKVKFTKVDGTYKFRSKQHAKVQDPKTKEVYDMKPRLLYIVDGKTVDYPEDLPTPWSGSKGEVELEVVPFDTFGGGLTFRLRAIRLHSIIEGNKPSGNWAEVDESFTATSEERKDPGEAVLNESDDFEEGAEEEGEEADEEEVW